LHHAFRKLQYLLYSIFQYLLYSISWSNLSLKLWVTWALIVRNLQPFRVRTRDWKCAALSLGLCMLWWACKVQQSLFITAQQWGDLLVSTMFVVFGLCF
jgi:hypothetical protein